MNPDRAAAFLKARVESGSVTWYDLAHFVAYYQAAHGLVVDGMPGEKTLTRLAGFVEEISGVHDLPEIARPDVRPTFDGPLDRVPRNRADVIALLGNPGKGTVDPSWFKANIITVRDLPGVPTKWFFQTHRLIEPYIREALRRAQLAAPDYHIERAASFVFRHQRHDKSRPLSYHSWGVSFDVDPGHNGSALFKPGQEPEPFSPAWRVRWPMGLPQAFVEAIESVGFAWGGRWKGFVDPMHFEFVGKTDVQV
jgi:hypothetical protein